MANSSSTPLLSHKLAVLVFIQNAAGQQLLIRRARMPNQGNWSPIGGKVETAQGESPFECAVRETGEEAGFKLEISDLHLFGMISEKAYEGQSHWLLFLFQCRKPIAHHPRDIDEGEFGFFGREELKSLSLPETDRTALWPIYDRYRERFVALRADCLPGKPLQVEIEEVTPP